MKRRHPMQGGGMNNNRRPQGGHRNHGGHGGHNNGGGFQQRPRKNFPALREKYLNMAKDAISGGDRVLAEYYLQHADHYYRMQAEFMAERNARFQNQPQGEQGAQPQDDQHDDAMMEEEAPVSNNSNALPAFITRSTPIAQTQDQQGDDKVLINANWEEE